MSLPEIPAAPFCADIADLQANLGQLDAVITRAIGDGKLTMTERNHLVIRLMGIARQAQHLALLLEVPHLTETKGSATL